MKLACAKATDSVFLSAITETTGVASNASTGLTAAAFLSESTALQAITVGANSRLYLILPPDVWKVVVLLRDTGGMLVTNNTIGPVRIIPSSAATDTGILIDSMQIAAANDDFSVMQAQYATIELDDNPTSGATTKVSLWQNNLLGLMAQRWFGCEVLRSSAAALITDMAISA